MKILITGGAGFIGSSLIRFIIRETKDTVINVDKLTYAGNLDSLKEVSSSDRYFFEQQDIVDLVGLRNIFFKHKPDKVIHLAAESHVDRSIDGASVFVQTNIVGTYNLLEAARKFKIKKYIQVSTDEVYGSIEKGSFKETDNLSPNSPYAASKAGADMLVRSYIVTYKLPAVITRSSNNFGPYQYPEKVIPLFITNLLEGKKVPLYGDGLNVRDWLYVTDNCEAVDFAMHNGKEGEIYNIAGGNEIPNIKLTKMILEGVGRDASFIEHVKDRPGHDRRYSLDCSKINKLGWKPRFEFHKALKETIKWYKENELWWKKLK